MSDQRDVELTYINVLYETAAAILFEFPEGEVWVPKSQIVDHDEESREVVIPEWLAIEKELV